jgi:hypothetical protein
MNGIIIGNGKKQVFRCDETKKRYPIKGVYDVDGHLRDEWKFPNAIEVEAVECDGGVYIKFAP